MVAVQTNDVVPVAPVPSVAVTVTVLVPAALAVPEITPVPELMDRPAGRPDAVQLIVWPPAESAAVIGRLAAVPTGLLMPCGLVTVTVLPALVELTAKDPVSCGLADVSPTRMR